MATAKGGETLEICIRGEAKEIAALVLELQERREKGTGIDPETLIETLTSGFSDAAASVRIP